MVNSNSLSGDIPGIVVGEKHPMDRDDFKDGNLF
jgi:hypothetical protein